MADVIDLLTEAKAENQTTKKYRAASARHAEGQLRTLTLIGSSGWHTSFWYADLRRLSYHVDSHFGKSPVLILRFTDPEITEAIIQGDELFPLYDDLLEQRIAWLWAITAEDDPPGDGATLIRKINLHR
jgi:hypothetical protein